VTSAAAVSPSTTIQPQTRISLNVRVLIGLAYIVLIGMAIGVRLFTFDRYMPVIDHYDESLRFLHAYSIRPDAPLGRAYGEIEWEAGFPPFQPQFTGMVQRLVESRMPFPLPSDYIYVMKAISAALGVLTTVILAGIGWMLGRPLGASRQALMGWLTALVWAIAPVIVTTGNFALMDPLLFPMIAGALWCAIYAIQHDSVWALMGSLACVILAIYTKYVVIYALWPVACAALVLIHRRGWRKMLPALAGMALFSALTAAYLIFVHGAFALDNRESNKFKEVGLQYMLSPTRNLDNLIYTIDQSVGLWLFGVVLIAGIAAYIYSQRRKEPVVNPLWLAVLLPFLIGCILLTSSVDVISQTDPKWFRVRYVLPVMPAIAAIWAGALTQTIFSLRNQGRKLLLALVTIAAVAVFGIPALAENISEAHRFAQTHGKEIMWTWSDVNLPPDGKILTEPNSEMRDLWNRPYSGYNGRTSFEWVFDENPSHTTPEGFVEQGVLYVAITSKDLRGPYSEPDVQAFLGQLFPLRVFPPGPGTEYSTTFYRMIPPQNTSDAVFGDQIALVGYDLSATDARPGDTITLRPYWRAAQTPSDNYSMFVHLLPDDTPQPVAQFDGAPASERRLTLTWDDPDETLIGTTAVLTLPADLPPGDYTLTLGLYDFVSGARLPLADGSDALVVTTISVQS
jgi:4-amino-4-deoxy-L-arabinose transferase-like glycosyltransferase